MSVAFIPASAAHATSAPTSVSAPTWKGAGPLSVTKLQVDGRTEPLGDDNTSPSFSWQLRSATANAHQSGYQLVVGTNRDGVISSKGVLWDSGKVTGPESVGVGYAGPALEPSTRYFWAVRVWNSAGDASAWSTPTWWETGRLGSDWDGAQWITPDTSSANKWQDFELDTDFMIKNVAGTILFRAADAANFYMWQINTATDPGHVMLRPHVVVNGNYTHLGNDVDLAPYLTADNTDQQHHLRVRVEGNTFTTFIDGHQVDERSDDTITGPGTIGFRASSTGGQDEKTLFDNLTVTDLSGTTLFTDDFSVTPDPTFPGVPIDQGHIEPGQGVVLMSKGTDSPLLRTDFALTKPIASARAYVYGLGLYELHLNGAKVGDLALTPTAGQDNTHLYYDTYDVTDQLRRGENAVGLWLGNGYDSNYNGYAFRYLGEKAAKMLLTVTYTDGTRTTVITSDAWKSSGSPIVTNDLYDGETYDATREQPGWDAAGFDQSTWAPVVTTDAPTSGALTANPAPPRRVVTTLTPVKVTNPRPGVFVFDLGQDIAGWTRLKVRGPRGTAVTMRTAEELGSDGLLDGFTNRNAKATDTFILRGGKAETYEPRFTYHGFRYVEVTGYPGTPTTADLQGRAVHADLQSAGSFTSSDPLLNKIWQNNRWAILNNSMSTPTDTPVRDERTPPAMDVQAYRDAAVRDFDMDGFYAKYLMDLPPGTALPQDDAKAQYPDMAGGQASLPWALYEQYGDRGTLKAAYPLMKAFVERNESDNPDYLWTTDTGLGDWCPPVHGADANGGLGSPSAGDCGSESLLVNTALWYHQEAAVAKAAKALGEADDAAHFTEVASKIKDAFNGKFLNARGDTYGDGRMTTSILPLAFGMVPAADRDAVGDQLVRTVLKANDGHLDTGIFGTRYLMDALAEIGRIDVAMTVLDQTSYPSFGYEIAHGGTTPWEQWTYNAGMITHDHAMFAGINSSFYTRLGGITPASPGYATMTIAPEVPASLSRVSVTQQTVRGEIASAWSTTSSRFTLTVTVPANTSARVEVPTFGNPATAVTSPKGAERRSHSTSDRAVFSVGSGTYRFTVPMRPAVRPGAVVVSGTAKVGHRLHAAAYSWTPTDARLSYAWHRSGDKRVLSTATGYRVRPADIGHTLTAKVTGQSPGMRTASATSTPVHVRKVAASLRIRAKTGRRDVVRLLVTVRTAGSIHPSGKVVAFAHGRRVGRATLHGHRALVRLRHLGHRRPMAVKVRYGGSAQVAAVTRLVVI